MNFELEWLIPNQICYLRISGKITISEVTEMNQHIMPLIESATESGRMFVHFIIDDSGVTSPELNIGELKPAIQAMRHPAFGWILSVGAVNPVSKLLFYMMSQLTRIRFRRFGTLDEAIDFLNKQDASLQWNKVDGSTLEQMEAIFS